MLFALIVRMVPDRDPPPGSAGYDPPWSLRAGVAERYTRRSQTPLGATSSGFESRLRHHLLTP
jgi:hypothetical protein